MEALQHNFFLRGFFKNRGYSDEKDVAAHQIPKLPAEAPSKTFALDGEQMFAAKDNAKLKNEGKLSEAGKYLAANPFSLAVIADSTPVLGDSKKNHALSEARAYVVRDYLIGKFKMDDTKVKTIGLGEDKDSSDGGKGQVRILVYTNAAAPGATSHPSSR
jgi:outer membrane protein OmpA-like peptidoglycan-associated protein